MPTWARGARRADDRRRRFPAAESRIGLLVEDRNAAIEITEQIVQFSDCFTRQR